MVIACVSLRLSLFGVLLSLNATIAVFTVKFFERYSLKNISALRAAAIVATFLGDSKSKIDLAERLLRSMLCPQRGFKSHPRGH